MHRRQLLFVAAAYVALAGCSDDVDPGENGTPDNDAGSDRVRIADHELVRENAGTEDETVAVEGWIHRLDDEAINYVELRARFYGLDEELLDSTTERVEDIDEGKAWPFRIEAPLVGERAAAVESYDLAVATVL